LDGHENGDWLDEDEKEFIERVEASCAAVNGGAVQFRKDQRIIILEVRAAINKMIDEELSRDLPDYNWLLEILRFSSRQDFLVGFVIGRFTGLGLAKLNYGNPRGIIFDGGARINLDQVAIINEIIRDRLDEISTKVAEHLLSCKKTSSA
jgi:hypothetical protein